MNSFLFGVWIGGSLGFIVGVWYTCRPLPTILNREPEWLVRRIARAPIAQRIGEEWRYLPADTVAWPEDFDPSARAALAELGVWRFS